MGTSCGSTTSQAARSWRITSSCPTQLTVNSSGWARWSGTPSISTTIHLLFYCPERLERAGKNADPITAPVGRTLGGGRGDDSESRSGRLYGFHIDRFKRRRHGAASRRGKQLEKDR